MLLYSDLEKLPEVVGKLHRVIQGGDYLHIDIVKKFRKWNQKGKIFNVGGPTETTMWNIYHEVSGEDIQNNNIPYAGKNILRINSNATGVVGLSSK